MHIDPSKFLTETTSLTDFYLDLAQGLKTTIFHVFQVFDIEKFIFLCGFLRYIVRYDGKYHLGGQFL